MSQDIKNRILAHVDRNKNTYFYWIRWINRLTLVPTLLLCLLLVYLAKTNQDDAEGYLWQCTNTFDSSDEGKIRAAFCSGVDINRQSFNGETFLIRAVRVENLDFVRILVKLGADTSLRDDNGNTALDTAKTHGYDKIVQFLCTSAKAGTG